MTKQFTVRNYRVRIVCEWAPNDFDLMFCLTGNGFFSQIGPFYFFFAYMRNK